LTRSRKPLPSDLSRKVLKEDPALVFYVANGIWVSPAAQLRDDFAGAERAALGAEIATLDFARVEAAPTINAWFARHTQGLIPEMIEALPPDTRVVLADALYFRGRWEEPFDPTLTADETFWPGGLRDGEPKPFTVPMMHARDRWLRYRETAAYQAVILPFAGRAFEAVIVLPRRASTDRSWTAGAAIWAKAQDAAASHQVLVDTAFEERPGELALPRFDLADSPDMALVLEGVGLRDAFTSTADFSGMAAVRSGSPRSRIRRC
jgi:serine protease inhibitor